MKTEFTPNPVTKGLFIPAEIADKTKLKKAEEISVYGNETALVLMTKGMTAWQIVKTVDMLNTVATGLIMRLENAARDFEETCQHVCIPQELLEMAGLPKGAPLEIMAGDGEIYISEAVEGDDPMENLPSFLRELFEDQEVDYGALRFLLDSEEPIHE